MVLGDAHIVEDLSHPVVPGGILVQDHILECSEILGILVLGLFLVASVEGHRILVVELGELVGIQGLHGILVGEGLDAVITVIAQAHLAARSFLGGDEHHAVGTAAAVDGRGESVLEHVYALDILGG